MNDHDEAEPEIGQWIDDGQPYVTMPVLRDDADHLKMHALLASYHDSEATREARIQRTLLRLTDGLEPREASFVSHRRSRWRQIGWTLSTLAAVVAIVCFLLIGQETAMAAAKRAVAVSRQLRTTHYEVDIELARPRGQLVRSCDLYSFGDSEYVAVFQDAMVQPAVIGRTDGVRWVKLGRQTWRSDQVGEWPAQRMFQIATLRYVHLSELLREIPDRYAVRFVESTSPGTKVIAARLIEPNATPNLPVELRVAVDEETYETLWLSARWTSNSTIQPIRLDARYVRTIDRHPSEIEAPPAVP